MIYQSQVPTGVQIVFLSDHVFGYGSDASSY